MLFFKNAIMPHIFVCSVPAEIPKLILSLSLACGAFVLEMSKTSLNVTCLSLALNSLAGDPAVMAFTALDQKRRGVYFGCFFL